MQGGNAGEYSGLLSVCVDDGNPRLSDETQQPAKRATVITNGAELADKVDRLVADARLLHSAPNRAVWTSGDDSTEALCRKFLHELSDVLGDASVTRLQGVEDQWLGRGHVTGA
jgi:hypothetical protein